MKFCDLAFEGVRHLNGSYILEKHIVDKHLFFWKNNLGPFHTGS